MSVRRNSFQSDKSNSKDATIARRLTTIVLTDFLCWFPISCLGLQAFTGTPIPSEVNVTLAIFVLPLNSTLNPFLYTLNIVLEKRRKARETLMLEQLAKQLASERHPEQGDVTSLVDNLPTDLATSALVESQNALNSSHVCSVCDDDVAATSYCLDCSVMLCKAPAELYCPHHQTLICLLCSSSKHRTCPASDGGTGGKDEDEVLVQESDLLQKKITELKQSSTAVSDIMANLQDVREQLNEKEQFLTTHREALTTITSTPLSLSSLQQARAACGGIIR
nr:hypothetical protein BaRGS_005932 [Batillaria attramentaria]